MDMTMPVLPTDMLAIVAKYPYPGQVKTRLGAVGRIKQVGQAIQVSDLGPS